MFILFVGYWVRTVLVYGLATKPKWLIVIP